MPDYLYAIEFINSLCPSEQYAILDHALKRMKKAKVSKFQDDGSLKAHLWLQERLEKFLNGEDYGGYDCDIHDCDKDAVYYNSNTQAFYCKEHN